MNGATAEPWLRTSNPPKATMVIIMGRSQYFFRTRKNAQSSIRKSIPAR